MCTAFPAEDARYGHVKMHHGYTNVLGLGDSSTWRLPCLNRYVYMFLAPLLIPIITPLVAVGECAGPGSRVAGRDLVSPPRSWRLLVEEGRSPELRLDRNFLRQPGRVERAQTRGQVWLSRVRAGDLRQVT